MAGKSTTAVDDNDTGKDWVEIEGHELLRSPGKVKGSDQIRLVGKLRDLGYLGDDVTSGGVDFLDMDLDALADFIDWVSAKFAINPDKFDEFTMGEDGYLKAMNLAVAYAAILGKEGKSES